MLECVASAVESMLRAHTGSNIAVVQRISVFET